MVIRPSAIIFVNNDLTDNVQTRLVRQLHINEVISGTEFDARVAADPDYPSNIKQLDLRIMVLRSFEELDNRDLADVVIFIKAALASILKNNFGPPGFTIAVLDIYWGKLCIY
jgi:hypothetical protein